MRIGAKLPSSGPLPTRIGIPAMAQRIEAAGFASLWVSDHVLMPERIDSHYPFAADGVARWGLDDPWYDAIVAMSMAAAVTERVEIGVAVLVLPLRHPVILAKELASLDALSGGRIALGVGAGWLAEEFDALNVPYASRGARMDEWVALLRACWTGRPPAIEGAHYQLPAGTRLFPTPAHDIPLLFGGVSNVALRRAATQGQGWLAHLYVDELDPVSLRAGAERIPDGHRLVLRVAGSTGRHGIVAEHMAELAGAGVTEVIVDLDWDADINAIAAQLLDAAAALP